MVSEHRMLKRMKSHLPCKVWSTSPNLNDLLSSPALPNVTVYADWPARYTIGSTLLCEVCLNLTTYTELHVSGAKLASDKFRDAQLTFDLVSYTAVNALHPLLILHGIWHVTDAANCHVQSQGFLETPMAGRWQAYTFPTVSTFQEAG